MQADDGGIYHLSDPAGGEPIWTNKNGNLRVAEFFSVAYDNLNDRIFGGTQDTGVAHQATPGSFVWDESEYAIGDGGTVDVGYFTIGDDWYSIRYSMGNNFKTFRRQVFDADGDDNNIGNFIHGGQADLEGLSSIDKGFDGFTVFPFELNRFDPSRVAVGGRQLLYESSDWADNLTVLNTGVWTGVQALAYGGMLAGVPNYDVLYAGFAGGATAVAERRRNRAVNDKLQQRRASRHRPGPRRLATRLRHRWDGCISQHRCGAQLDDHRVGANGREPGRLDRSAL